MQLWKEGGIMAHCDCRNSCFFYNELTTDKPKCIEHLKRFYCEGRFSECAIYLLAAIHGIEQVPKYLYPSSHINTETFRPDG